MNNFKFRIVKENDNYRLNYKDLLNDKIKQNSTIKYKTLEDLELSLKSVKELIFYITITLKYLSNKEKVKITIMLTDTIEIQYYIEEMIKIKKGK